MCFLGSFWG